MNRYRSKTVCVPHYSSVLASVCILYCMACSEPTPHAAGSIEVDKERVEVAMEGRVEGYGARGHNY